MVPGASVPFVNGIEILPVVSVAVSPGTSGLNTSQAQQFTPTVTGSSNGAVTWTISPAGTGSITPSGLYTAPASVATGQTVTVTATSVADPTKSANASVTLAAQAFAPIRINSGGPAYTDPSGTAWQADSGSTGGDVFSVSNPIANTATPVVYQTVRYSSSAFGYGFTVPNGTYAVKLKFAEVFFGNAGQRVFDILLNGQTVSKGFDPIVAAGAPFTAADMLYSLTVSNGSIQIQFSPVVSLPFVNGIEIVQGAVAPGVSVTVTPGSGSLAAGQTQQFTATVTGSSNTAVTWKIAPTGTGTVTPAGLYTAPASIATAQTVTVTATSAADTTKSASATVTLNPPSITQQFTLTEQFGVAHASQVVDFDYSGSINPGQTYLLNAAGAEVPFQQLGNQHIAVLTDLPANGSRSWTLNTGRAPSAFPNTVTLRTSSTYYEISNGLTGVRITRPDQTASTTLAPIQGVQLRDGTWTAGGPNYLYPQGDGPSTPLPAVSAAVSIVEQGPLQFTAKVSYAYNRPALYYGNDVLLPAGSGHFYSTITVQAGQPSVLVEDETDMDLQYFLNVYGAVRPNQARYRGHDSTSVENGWEPSGIQYRPNDQRPEVDATRGLQYGMPGYSSYGSGNYGSYQYIKRMATWDPWASDTGWYYMIYNNGAGAAAPLVGTFAGSASRALGVSNSGVGVYTMPNNGNPQAGFNFQSNRRDPNGLVFPLVRVSWGLFVGTQGGDLGDPYAEQNINLQMNLHGGINLNKISRLQTNFPDPSGGYQPLYMTNAAVQSVINRVRTDPNYYNFLYNIEPTARPLLDSWRDATGATALVLLGQIQQDAQQMLNAYLNGTGIYSIQYQYWLGGLIMSRDALFINDLMCCDSLPATAKSRLKPPAALFADLLWDNDFVPLFVASGVNLGTANMPVQEQQYRDLYTLMLPNLTMMQGLAPQAQADIASSIAQQINAWGAQVSSPHYAEAGMGPLLSAAQQLQITGTDYYQSDPHLANFARFYMNLMTPPEVRFGGLRKLISAGDGATEGSELFGQMGTALAPSNAALSSQLMGMWNAEGKVESGFQGTTVLKINDQLPAVSPLLGSATFPGWCSVLRYAYDTPNETALWVINGDFYSDHRHQDQGNAILYALGAPLSIDWGSMYSPQTAGAYMHSAVLPEAAIGQAWNADVSLDTTASPWQTSTQNLFLSFDYSSAAVSSFQSQDTTTWTRTAYNIHPNASYPVIELNDTFTGPGAAASKVFSMNFMSQPGVQTPAGLINPSSRFYDGTRTDLPSGGNAFAIPAGVSQFHFTGQWLIDWDLFNVSSTAKQGLIGNWGHNWAPDTESNQFQGANGTAFQETQDILRMRGTDSFQVLLLPYRKTAPRSSAVTQNGGGIQIAAGNEQTQVGNQSYAYTGNGLAVLTTFGAQAAAANGIQISGGPTEVVIAGARVSITAHGTAGTRQIAVPGLGINFTLTYTGGSPLKVTL